MKAVLKTFASVLVGVVLVTSLPSCKNQEDCGAYQGSGKSTRSHKKNKRHSNVIQININHRA